MQKRPININPLSIRLPIAALVSITHRLSGILVFLLIPFILLSFGQSLASPESFAALKEYCQGIGCQAMLWALYAGLIFHLLAGMRHLLMDVHCGDSLIAGRVSAVMVIIVTLGILLASYWYWG